MWLNSVLLTEKLSVHVATAPSAHTRECTKFCQGKNIFWEAEKTLTEQVNSKKYISDKENIAAIHRKLEVDIPDFQSKLVPGHVLGKTWTPAASWCLEGNNIKKTILADLTDWGT